MNILADPKYLNVFVDVHNKVREFKDRLREVNKGHADLREDRFVQEIKEINDTERPVSS